MSHAEASPSQLPRIILCPGSRRKVKQHKRPQETVYAEEGTMLHRVVFLRIQCKYQKYLKSPAVYKDLTNELSVYDLNRDQLSAVCSCMDYLEDVIREIELTSELLYIRLEQETSLAWLGLPEVEGHSDVVIYSRDRRDVLDWKFGQGIFVSPVANAQAVAYLGGSFNSAKELAMVDACYTHIVQPRLDNMSCERYTKTALMEFLTDVIKPQVLLSREPDAPVVPGEKQCKFCVGVTCAERVYMAREFASKVFADYVEGKPAKDFVPLEELGDLLEKAKLVEQFIKDLSVEVLSHCLNGKEYPGYKVVEGRSYRSWVDEDVAMKFLLACADDPEYDFELEDLYESKFVSPAKAEKLNKQFKKADEFKILWHKPSGQAVLVPDSDPRQPIKDTAQSAFTQYVEQPGMTKTPIEK